MTKSNYLERLYSLLDQYNMNESLKEDIIKDYDTLWQEYQELNMIDIDIVEKLGQPEVIIESLTEGYTKKEIIHKRKKQSSQQKFIALTPFIALFMFFGLGFLVEDGFTYAWVSFLLIPMSAIILQGPKNLIEKLTALSPFIAIIVYIPILGFYFGLWHPGWLVFLLTAIIGGLSHPKIIHRIFISGGLLLTSIVYLILEVGLDLGNLKVTESIQLPYSAFVFLPVVLILLWVWFSQIIKNGIIYLILLLVSTFIFLFLSIQYDLWLISWLVFFSIPMYAIIRHTKKDEKLIALMPLISTILFMLIGYFFNGWAFGWLVYLFIPMVAIIKGK
jgi:hypothetical protein